MALLVREVGRTRQGAQEPFTAAHGITAPRRGVVPGDQLAVPPAGSSSGAAAHGSTATRATALDGRCG